MYPIETGQFVYSPSQKRDGDVQTEAEAMINEYLNALQHHYNGQVRHWLMKHSETFWKLVILYHSDGEGVRDYY